VEGVRSPSVLMTVIEALKFFCWVSLPSVRVVLGMSELRGQQAPGMGFLSAKDTWQQIQLVIGERGRAVTRAACSSG